MCVWIQCYLMFYLNWDKKLVSLERKINIYTAIILLIIIKMKAFVINGGITSNE